MHSELRTYWRHPGYWRWRWSRVSGETKAVMAMLVAAGAGAGTAIAFFLIAEAPDEPRAVATATTQRVVTVVPVTRANATTRAADVQMAVLSITPRPPRAGQQFELVARVDFAPAPGSIRCSVWIGRERYRQVRLTWKNSIARCVVRVPDRAGGKRLQIGLSAVLSGSRSSTTVGFRVL